jgi:small subunit ribosomal protein S11
MHEHYYHLHINTSTKNIHVTITNHRHDPVVVLSAGRLGLKHSRRGTIEAGVETTLQALKMFREKYPSVVRQGEVELVLKGYGRARDGAINAILGPMGAGILARINRVTDATTLAIGGVKAPNPKRN